MIFFMSTLFPHLGSKVHQVSRVAERGFVTLEGLLDQEIASVIHKDFRHQHTSTPVLYCILHNIPHRYPANLELVGN